MGINLEDSISVRNEGIHFRSGITLGKGIGIPDADLESFFIIDEFSNNIVDEFSNKLISEPI